MRFLKGKKVTEFNYPEALTLKKVSFEVLGSFIPVQK